MAVEIYQLNVNINVTGEQKKEAPAGGGGNGGSVNKKEIIDSCVETVLEIISQKEMR